MTWCKSVSVALGCPTIFHLEVTSHIVSCSFTSLVHFPKVADPNCPLAMTQIAVSKFATSRRSGTLGCGFGLGFGAPGATLFLGAQSKIIEHAPVKINMEAEDA